MKKRISAFILMLMLLLSPVILFACDENLEKFNISVNVLYGKTGIVYGQGTYVDGEDVTISATPKGESTFIAWLHNDVIVSYDSVYKFKAGNDTSGIYTAIFTTEDLGLVVPTQIRAQSNLENGENITEFTATVNMGTSYDFMHEVFSDNFDALNSTSLGDFNFCFDKRTKIILEVDLTFKIVVVANNQETEITRTQKTYIEVKLNDQLSTDFYPLNLPDGVSGSVHISLDFKVFEGALPAEPEEPAEE